MVVFACYSCKAKFKIPDPYSAPDFECPECHVRVEVPEKPCGECICSAQIADENLICCMVSTTEKIMLIPFNMDAASDGVCPHFQRIDDDDAADAEYEDHQYEDLVEELENLDKETKDEKEEPEDDFDKAFDEL